MVLGVQVNPTIPDAEETATIIIRLSLLKWTEMFSCPDSARRSPCYDGAGASLTRGRRGRWQAAPPGATMLVVMLVLSACVGTKSVCFAEGTGVTSPWYARRATAPLQNALRGNYQCAAQRTLTSHVETRQGAQRALPTAAAPFSKRDEETSREGAATASLPGCFPRSSVEELAYGRCKLADYPPLMRSLPRDLYPTISTPP